MFSLLNSELSISVNGECNWSVQVEKKVLCILYLYNEKKKKALVNKRWKIYDE